MIWTANSNRPKKAANFKHKTNQPVPHAQIFHQGGNSYKLQVSKIWPEGKMVTWFWKLQMNKHNNNNNNAALTDLFLRFFGEFTVLLRKRYRLLFNTSHVHENFWIVTTILQILLPHCTDKRHVISKSNVSELQSIDYAAPMHYLHI